MDVANNHLERIVSVAQSNGWKMQWHHLLMEGLVGQQQMLLSKLVMMSSAKGSGGVIEVIEDQEEPQESQGEESGGQDSKTEGAMGEGPGGVPEDELGNELENDTGAEVGTKEDGQQSKAKDKGKARAL
ncbi:hypothetical protein ID866_10670 [Astraeus odoratus]|nr:hypothetical protein ID866_10670 [Astraeus odoratus]